MKDEGIRGAWQVNAAVLRIPVKAHQKENNAEGVSSRAVSGIFCMHLGRLAGKCCAVIADMQTSVLTHPDDWPRPSFPVQPLPASSV